MAQNLIQKQLRPSAASLTTLYTVAADMVNSSITVCNTSSVATTYRIAIRALGAAISDVHYIVYDAIIVGNSSECFQLGYTLLATDIVSVYATLATVNFHLCGQEK